MVSETGKTVVASELVGLRPLEQIKVLQTRNRVARQVLNPDSTDAGDSLISESRNFSPLTQNDAMAYKQGGDKTKPLEWFNMPSGLCFLNQASHTYFEINFSGSVVLDQALLDQFKEITGVDPFQFFLRVLDNAIHRYNKIRTSFDGRLQRSHSFSIEFDNGNIFTTPMAGGERVGIGIKFLHDLLKAYISNDTEELRTIMTSIESQYFHELVHLINTDNNLDNNTIEELTLLAEFLYDPLNNSKRNSGLFAKFGSRILEEDKLRVEERWSDRYDGAYKAVTSKILLKELHDRGMLTTPLSADEIQNVLSNIHEYYAAIPQEERDQILAKYLPIKVGELFAIGERITQEMHLPY